MEKCLHILPMNKLSGAEKIALIMCKNMKKYKPVVVCGGDELSKFFIENNIESFTLNFSKKYFIKDIMSLSKIIKTNNIKVVHAHDNIASVISYFTKKIFKLNIVVISHIHNCYPWLKENGMNKFIDSKLRPKYDYNVTCGKVVYDFYINNTTYFNKDKTAILSNCIDIDNIKKIKLMDKDIIKKTYNIPKSKIVIGYIGRLDEQKGILQFIHEFSKQKEDFKDSVILLVGNGDKETEVKELIKTLNLEEYFILTGFQKEVYNFYNVIDIFFLPSLYEGLPMVILEAMSFKKAIVAMDVGSISEVIKDNTGILVKSNRYKDFINELKKLKSNEEIINEYGKNAYKLIEDEFNIKDYTEKIENQYDVLLAE